MKHQIGQEENAHSFFDPKEKLFKFVSTKGTHSKSIRQLIG